MTPPPARCRFHVRTPAGNGLYNFERVGARGERDDGALHTHYPPAIGDVIELDYRTDNPRFRMGKVIARDWSYPMHGSHDWPYSEPAPKSGPLVTIIVEPTEGLFANRAPISE